VQCHVCVLFGFCAVLPLFIAKAAACPLAFYIGLIAQNKEVSAKK
jgi:hypothetical protein